MKTYYLILIAIGITSIFASFLPIILEKFKISFTIPLLLLGVALFFLRVPLPWPNPKWPVEFSLKFTEIVVIISVMVAGLKIGLHYSISDWKAPLRLIGITMPLFMIGVFLVAYFILEMEGAISMLLAAVLSPTDPALASEIQLNNKQSKQSKDTGARYTLTAEAGINDGLAFPFVFLAILWSKAKDFQAIDFWHWFSFYFCFKIGVGIFIGVAVGYAYSYLTSRISISEGVKIHQSFVALALTVMVYGIAEIAHSYGFLAVFFCGLFSQFHNFYKGKDTQSEPNLHFIENVEKLLIVFWTLFFGGSIVAGILNKLTLPLIIFSSAIVLLLRPAMGYLGLLLSKLKKREHWVVSFYGVRGIGSVFYLLFAVKEGEFGNVNAVYSIVALVILLSIIFHGTTARRIFSNN